MNPILIDNNHNIIAGHGRVEAAKLLSLNTIPTLEVEHLSDAEKRAYILADNKLALNAGWDKELLALELQGLLDLEFDIELTGFSLAEIDFVLDDAKASDPEGSDLAENAIPAIKKQAVSQTGYLWLLGRHKLLCGDAQDPACFEKLIRNERIDLVLPTLHII